jgi:hypothetical protein
MQRVLLFCLPKAWHPSIIADSQAWKVICPCGGMRSIWEIGGIRWKAAGNPRKLMRCPKCGHLTWHRTEKRAPVTPPAASTGSV